VLAVNGFAADGNMFVKRVRQRLEVCIHTVCPTHRYDLCICFQWYRHAHAKDMPLRAIARLIQTMLYGRRFFPYYVYNILGGIEEDGAANLLPLRFPLILRDRYSILILYLAYDRFWCCLLLRPRGFIRT